MMTSPLKYLIASQYRVLMSLQFVFDLEFL